MKRDQLKELGLTDEQIDKIMGWHGADVEKAKATASDAESLKTENDSLKAQLTERDKDIKTLTKQAGNSDELNKQLEDLQNKYQADTEALQGQLQQTKLNGALDTILSSSKVRNPKAAKALLNMDEIKLNDKGELEGVDDQIASLKESDAYLFDEGQKGSYTPGGGNGSDDNNQVQTLVDAFKD